MTSTPQHPEQRGHTPTPWSYRRDSFGQTYFGIIPPGSSLFDPQVGFAWNPIDAALIVEAVNNHARLLAENAALREALAKVRDIIAPPTPARPGRLSAKAQIVHDLPLEPWAKIAVESIDLALAGGKGVPVPEMVAAYDKKVEELRAAGEFDSPLLKAGEAIRTARVGGKA